MREAHSLLRHTVQLRRSVPPCPVTTQVAITQIIGEYENDVGWLLASQPFGQQQPNEKSQERKRNAHKNQFRLTMWKGENAVTSPFPEPTRYWFDAEYVGRADKIVETRISDSAQLPRVPAAPCWSFRAKSLAVYGRVLYPFMHGGKPFGNRTGRSGARAGVMRISTMGGLQSRYAGAVKKWAPSAHFPKKHLILHLNPESSPCDSLPQRLSASPNQPPNLSFPIPAKSKILLSILIPYVRHSATERHARS